MIFVTAVLFLSTKGARSTSFCSSLRRVVSQEMRHLFIGLLLTCVVFSANANRFAYPNFHLRRLPAAATVENASAASFSGNTLISNPSARTERTASVLPRFWKNVSFPTKHEEEAADWSAASQTTKTAEEQRPSVGVKRRSDGRFLRHDDDFEDEAPASTTFNLSSRTLS